VKITVEIERDGIRVSKSVEVNDGNPRYAGFEANRHAAHVARTLAGCFGDPDERPSNAVDPVAR
jgi:hypothetical protein